MAVDGVYSYIFENTTKDTEIPQLDVYKPNGLGKTFPVVLPVCKTRGKVLQKG